MHNGKPDRRSFLKAMSSLGSTGFLAALPETASAIYRGNRNADSILDEAAMPVQDAQIKPEQTIRFSVIGLDHYHIMAMTAAVIRGGGELVSVHATDPKAIADFLKLYPQAKLARSEEEILNDSSIQMVAGVPIPNLRAPLGIRVMRHGKDYLSDKPAITTLEQLAEVRQAIAETGRIFAIMYSERLENRAAVKAGELVHAGAIGKVVQTINIAPHQVNDITRPAWFWDPQQYGGILCDIGSHQADQFVYYTGSTTAAVTASQCVPDCQRQSSQSSAISRLRRYDAPRQWRRGLRACRLVYARWIGTWGDGRLFLLGTEGYIELRKYVDVAGRKGGNHLFLVDRKEARYIDCNNVPLPFGPQLVSDVVNRTHTGQDQAQALLATELVLEAQKRATVLTFDV